MNPGCSLLAGLLLAHCTCVRTWSRCCQPQVVGVIQLRLDSSGCGYRYSECIECCTKSHVTAGCLPRHSMCYYLHACPNRQCWQCYVIVSCSCYAYLVDMFFFACTGRQLGCALRQQAGRVPTCFELPQDNCEQ